ncbi:alginate O-acetyltransferase AlgX-related protein [Jannaschia sp. W003]|uniref:alginate O-acetyltransferase AlgX-related protein n=1 Tax=Jannaschia sp. W003 TaxID=2867012 RepID=UPI0021A31D8D|nr:hypothetical protein [Jannaschia sp. W003]UWQ22096.1 hypothetical protein K3554_03425 [Jannaschia sp. W003]
MIPVRRHAAAALLGLAALNAAPAATASQYGCRGIEAPGFGMIEGREGAVFRIDPDLHADHWMTDGTVARIARLADALAAGGTRLVVVPVPTKSMAMPEELPLLAAHAGFDSAMAASLYGENLRRLRARGVLAVDGRAAMRRLALAGTAPFPALDPRPTPEGLRALAAAVGETLDAAGLRPDAPRRFESQAGAPHPVPSAMRARLAARCDGDLPSVKRAAWTTRVLPSFDAAAPAASVAVAASALGGAEPFAGFVQEATGRLADAVLHVEGEDAFSAITSLLAGPALDAGRPEVLVWAFPVWADLAARGDAPWAELTAAAAASCASPMALGADPATGRLRAALAAVPAGPGAVLRLETGTPGARRASFVFVAADGARRVRSVHRAADAATGGRFYVPLAGLFPGGAAGVEIETDAGFGPRPALSVCTLPEERS